MSDPVTIDVAIERLNSMLAADPVVMHSLMNIRVTTNKTMADHPTAQVLPVNGMYMIGLLGVINGIFGADDGDIGYIAMLVNNDEKVTGFIRANP